MQSRLKSPVLWVSIATLVAFVLKTYFEYEIPQFDKLVDLILIVASGLGIVNNPVNKEGI